MFWVGVDDDEFEAAEAEAADAFFENVKDVFEWSAFECSASAFDAAERDLVAFDECSAEESAFEEHCVCLDGDALLRGRDGDVVRFFHFCSAYFDIFAEADFGVSAHDAVHADDCLSDVGGVCAVCDADGFSRSFEFDDIARAYIDVAHGLRVDADHSFVGFFLECFHDFEFDVGSFHCLGSQDFCGFIYLCVEVDDDFVGFLQHETDEFVDFVFELVEGDEFAWDGNAEAVADHAEFDLELTIFEGEVVFIILEVAGMINKFVTVLALERAEGESFFEDGVRCHLVMAFLAEDDFVKDVVFHGSYGTCIR